MSLCLNTISNQYDYCTSHLPTYITIGIIIPIGVLIIILLVYVYLRFRQRRLRRAQQQTYMATIVPIYNSEDQRQTPFSYSYPPHYAAMPEDTFDKPPSYEQTVQQISEMPRTTISDNQPSTLPRAEEPTGDRH